jgi:hypothetical protein
VAFGDDQAPGTVTNTYDGKSTFSSRFLSTGAPLTELTPTTTTPDSSHPLPWLFKKYLIK